MKEFTAIYNTEAIEGVQYAFKAETIDEAISFAEKKFTSFPNIAIVEQAAHEWSAEGVLVFLNGARIINVNGRGDARR